MHLQSDQHSISTDPDVRPGIPRTHAIRFGIARPTLRTIVAGVLVLTLAACGPGGPPVNDVTADDGAGVPGFAESAVNRSPPAAASRTPTGNRASTTTPAAATAPTTTVSAAAPTALTIARPAVTGGPLNTVDTIVNDMKLNNDLRLAGVPLERGWATGPGQVIMGNDPRGTRTPTWWMPADKYFKGAAYWTQIVPWMVIFDGVGNAATNTRVELRNMKAYYKSRSSGQWILLSQGTIDGQNYPKYLNATQSGRPDIVSLGSGVVSVRPPSTDLHFHGWCCARSLPAPADIAAIHITLQARLTVHETSRPDDRAAARYLVQVGGDYYPDASLNLNAFAPVNWNPGIGLSRSKLVGNTWQAYSFTTINVGTQDPGGAAISEDELRRAPPPLD
jgi:hypothetical protein